ncbi:conserved hypothetical protein [Vibrio chagasii]|nr:conserved hypothetical protein [Vibrio chagasii]
MFKSEEEKKIEKLAKQYAKKDKRLSWETCVKKAKESQRRFGA